MSFDGYLVEELVRYISAGQVRRRQSNCGGSAETAARGVGLSDIGWQLLQ